MSLDWQPSEHFGSLARQAGLPDLDAMAFAASLGEFRAFWLGKLQVVRNQHEWDHSLLKSLKADALRQARAPTAPRGPSREDARRAASATRLSDVLNEDGTPKTSEVIDDRTIECSAAPRLVG